MTDLRAIAEAANHPGTMTAAQLHDWLAAVSSFNAAWRPDRALAALDVIERAASRERAEEALADSATRTHDGSAREREHLESDRAVAIHDLRAAVARWDALR